MTNKTGVRIRIDDQTLVQVSQAMCESILTNPRIDPMKIDSEELAKKAVSISQALGSQIFGNEAFVTGVIEGITESDDSN